MHGLSDVRPHQPFLRPGFRIALVAAGVMLMLVTGIALAVGHTRLLHVIPVEYTLREEESAPATGRPLEVVKAATIDELEAIAGFSLLKPTFLPERCAALRSAHYLPETRVTAITYSCLDIQQQRGDRVYRPPVPEGSLQRVTVNGSPAVFFVTPLPPRSLSPPTPLQDPVTSHGPAKTEEGWEFRDLIFEANGLIVRLSTFPKGAPTVPENAPLSKEELIKIAESMAP